MAIVSEYLDIVGADVPVQKTYEFGGKTYLFDVKYNDTEAFFTIEIYDINTNTFLFSNKIVYGQPLIDSKLAPFQDTIIPLNLDYLKSGNGTREITKETLGNEIKLYTSIIQDDTV